MSKLEELRYYVASEIEDYAHDVDPIDLSDDFLFYGICLVAGIVGLAGMVYIITMLF